MQEGEKRKSGRLNLRLTPGRATFLVSLVLTLLMFSQPIAGASPLTVTPAKAAYSPISGVEPNPEFATNVSISSVNLSCGALCAASVSGQHTTYAAIGQGIILDPHVANGIRYLDPTHIVAPGIYQDLALPGTVAGCTGSTHTCEDLLDGANWASLNSTLPTYAPSCPFGGSCLTLHSPLVAPTVSNFTDSYSTYGGSAGLKIVKLTMNNSAKRANSNVAVLSLPLGQAEWPSLNPSNDYLNVIESLSSSTSGSVAATGIGGIGLENLSGMSTAPIAFLGENQTSGQLLSMLQLEQEASKSGNHLLNNTWANDTYQVSHNSTNYLDYNYTSGASVISSGMAAMFSAPLSDFSGSWGNYKAPGLNFSSGCSTSGATQCTTQANLTVFLETGPSSTAGTNLTLTIWGLSISSAPLSIGSTFSHFHEYEPTKASGTNYRGPYVNSTATRGIADQWTNPFAYTSLSPSWGNSGWVNTTGIQESWSYPATALTNVTSSFLKSATNDSGQGTYQFHFDYPASGSIAYGCAQVWDQKVAGTYVTVTGETPPAIQGSDLSASFNAATVHVGNRTQITGGSTCSPAAAPGPGVHQAALPLGAGVLSSTNAVINETVDYANVCNLMSCSTGGSSGGNNNSSGNGGGFLSSTVSATGIWILFAAVVVIALVLVAFGLGDHKGHEHAGRKMKGRGVGRLPFALHRSRRGVSKQTEVIAHDASGIAWMVVVAVIAIAAFFGLMTTGVLGFQLSQEIAAAIVIFLVVVLVIMVVVWEETKTRVKEVTG